MLILRLTGKSLWLDLYSMVLNMSDILFKSTILILSALNNYFFKIFLFFSIDCKSIYLQFILKNIYKIVFHFFFCFIIIPGFYFLWIIYFFLNLQNGCLKIRILKLLGNSWKTLSDLFVWHTVKFCPSKRAAVSFSISVYNFILILNILILMIIRILSL